MNKKSLKVKVLFLFLILICFSLVINAADVKKDIIFAYAVHAIGGDPAKIKIQGALSEIEKLGWKSLVVSAEGSLERHVANIETLALSGNIDFLGIGGGDARSLEPAIDFVRELGIPIISFDAGLIREGVITNVTSDNAETGRDLARYLFDKIGGKGNIVLCEEPMFWACRLRVEAMRKVLKEEYPDIKIVATVATQYPDGTQQAMVGLESILIAHPKGTIQAVYCDHDLPAVGATRAIMAAGRSDEIIVGGVDADELSVKEYVSKNTPFIVTVAVDYFQNGVAGVNAANEYLHGKRDFPESIYMPTLLITRENAQEYIEKMWPEVEEED